MNFLCFWLHGDNRSITPATHVGRTVTMQGASYPLCTGCKLVVLRNRQFQPHSPQHTTPFWPQMSDCFTFWILSFGWFPGVRNLCADVSEHSVSSIFISDVFTPYNKYGPQQLSRYSATCYELDGLGIESQWALRISAPVQTGPGTHAASCTIETGSYSRRWSGSDLVVTIKFF